MEIVDELLMEADMAENLGDPADGAYLMRAVAEIKKLRYSLADANDLCRSAFQIAERGGAETDWPKFRAQLSASLARQHDVMYRASA